MENKTMNCKSCKHATFVHVSLIKCGVVRIETVENYQGTRIGSCPNALMAICHEDDPACDKYEPGRNRGRYNF